MDTTSPLKDETLLLLFCHPMIKYAEVKDGDAAVRVVHKQFHFSTFVIAYPLEIAVRHLLRHRPAVESVGVDHYDVGCGLRRVVARSHQLVVRPCVADTCMTDAATDVRLNHPVHFRIDAQRDRLVDVFKERIPRELRSAHKVG